MILPSLFNLTRVFKRSYHTNNLSQKNFSFAQCWPQYGKILCSHLVIWEGLLISNNIPFTLFVTYNTQMLQNRQSIHRIVSDTLLLMCKIRVVAISMPYLIIIVHSLLLSYLSCSLSFCSPLKLPIFQFYLSRFFYSPQVCQFLYELKGFIMYNLGFSHQWCDKPQDESERQKESGRKLREENVIFMFPWVGWPQPYIVYCISHNYTRSLTVLLNYMQVPEVYVFINQSSSISQQFVPKFEVLF